MLVGHEGEKLMLVVGSLFEAKNPKPLNRG